ncbi:acyltransferase [Novosphingobium naphthalenivorans]|uniref:acyltransferase n=1 Tax=Novosphingobium naphthalenivorans TaxID=273168 RepID=UPI00082E9151|nr:acyltransferase [Novosphingobium naphthalenivorans]
MRQAARSWAMRAYVRAAYRGVSCHPTVRFGRGARLRCFDGGTLTLGAGVALGDFAYLEAAAGHLEIGGNCEIGKGAIVVSREAVSIGDGTLVAEYCTIRDADHRHSGDDRLADQGFETAPIRIGRDVWLGAKVTVTRGVELADHCVIGANSVVTRSAAERGIYAGVPARRIR